MNQALSLRPAQVGGALILLAALGFTALVGLAALDPAVEPGATSPARPVEAMNEALPVRGDVLTPRFERSHEPAIETDPANAHGG
jgi:hypothetical protein